MADLQVEKEHSPDCPLSAISMPLVPGQVGDVAGESPLSPIPPERHV